jgi:glycosyltransferase involved in cell wall biosynthesis
MLHKECGYDCTIASYKTGDYPYINTEVKGLKQVFVRKITNNATIDFSIHILFNLNKIDVLQAYHLSIESVIILSFFNFFKFFGKPSKTYLKLDLNVPFNEQKFHGLKGKILRKLTSKIDLISVETKLIYDSLVKSNILGRNIYYIPNGFYDQGIKEEIEFSAKQNIILTVARIGSFPKYNEILLEAFANFSRLNFDWQLELIGPIEPPFYDYINRYFEINPHLKTRVQFIGEIVNRKVLEEKYKKAKIFVMTSRKEGFATVFLEAMKSGCTILSSAINSAYDLTDNEKYGRLFQIGNSIALTDLLLEFTSDEQRLKDNCRAVQSFVYGNFYWPLIVRKIDIVLGNN